MDSASAENTNRLKPLNDLSKYNNYYFNSKLPNSFFFQIDLIII